MEYHRNVIRLSCSIVTCVNESHKKLSLKLTNKQIKLKINCKENALKFDNKINLEIQQISI